MDTQYINRKKKCKERAAEMPEKREMHLTSYSNHYQKCKKQKIVIDENESSKQIRQISAINTEEQQVQNVNVQEMQSSTTMHIEPISATFLTKSSYQKSSNKNDMDPGEVPQELQGLIEIEEMLIIQVFL
ncbi:19249_t:CDS:2 [Gigaspora margarita]|uniref:19249_t:CDS:1 n=1 Tax=Gigaspora margarita TaxID=4874 RepID=A0ABN7V7G3_GIGMA|nr:19249_t:CDS:2 [Gigaspora margarita]